MVDNIHILELARFHPTPPAFRPLLKSGKYTELFCSEKRLRKINCLKKSNTKVCGKQSEPLVVKTNEQIYSFGVRVPFWKHPGGRDQTLCASSGAPRLLQGSCDFLPSGGPSELLVCFLGLKPLPFLNIWPQRLRSWLNFVHCGHADKRAPYLHPLIPLSFYKNARLGVGLRVEPWRAVLGALFFPALWLQAVAYVMHSKAAWECIARSPRLWSLCSTWVSNWERALYVFM